MVYIAPYIFLIFYKQLKCLHCPIIAKVRFQFFLIGYFCPSSKNTMNQILIYGELAALEFQFFWHYEKNESFVLSLLFSSIACQSKGMVQVENAEIFITLTQINLTKPRSQVNLKIWYSLTLLYLIDKQKTKTQMNLKYHLPKNGEGKKNIG